MIEHRATGQCGAADPARPVRVRLTAFEVCAGRAPSPSWEVVRRVPERLAAPGGTAEVDRKVLPACVDGAMAAARALVDEQPDVLVVLGVDRSATTLRLETTATHPATHPATDRADGPLVPDGPPRLPSTWQAGAMVGRLRAAGHRVERSEDAGRELCNAALYAALNAAQGPGRRGPAPVIGLLCLAPPEVIPADQAAAALRDLIIELSDQARRGRCARGGWSRLSVHRGRRVIRVGLTGGIGAGKSTAARELRDRGAHIVDADAIAREVLEPGTPGLAAVARAFGPRVLEADGSLDRAALAEIVFDDPSARSRLETLTLPLIAETAAERIERHGGARVAVYDVPLLAEGGMADLFDCVVVVEAPLEERLARLAGRGMSRSQALERMSHQAGDRERRAVADVVLSNDASPDDLAVAVGRLWRCLTAQ